MKVKGLKPGYAAKETGVSEETSVEEASEARGLEAVGYPRQLQLFIHR
jgi:hypothetical protein